MDSARSIQEATALRDIAYVLRYGHFPGDSASLRSSTEEQGDESPSPLHAPFEDEGVGEARTSSSSLASGANTNPFEEEGLKIDLNPFGEDDEGEDEGEDEDDLRGGGRGRGVIVPPSLTSSSTTSPRSPLSSGVVTGRSSPSNSHASPSSPLGGHFFRASLPSSRDSLEVGEVTRGHTEEVISVAFNLTRLDLRRLIDDTGRNQVPPRAEILLEEIRTEGLRVAPLAGTSRPPLLFFRAVVSGQERFTSFSSTSATNTTSQSLSLPVKNMYKETLVMEVWAARESALPEPQSGPVLDILGRLITGSRRNKKDANRRPPASPTKADIEEHPTGVEDEVDHSDDTPVINTSLWDERKPRGGRPRAKDQPKDEPGEKVEVEEQPNGDEEETKEWNGAAEQSLDTNSIASDHSGDHLRTSTPAGGVRASSLQHLELSNVGDEDSTLERKKPKSRGLKSMGASLRSSIRRGLNQAHNSMTSPSLSRRAPDASSMRSATSDASFSNSRFDEDDSRLNRTTGDEAKKTKKSKLERSLSSLSIASITKRSMSMRIASTKATEVFRRIGSMKERGYKKGSYSLEDAAASSASSSKLSTQGLEDNVSQRSYNLDHNASGEDEPDFVDSKDEGQLEEDLEEEEEVPHLERTVANSNITVPRSIFNKWKDQRTLRAFRRSPKKAQEEDLDGWRQEAGRASPVADNPDGIREYLASIGKANLKADLVGHVKIPIKDVVGTWEKESWFPMTLIRRNNETPRSKKGKSAKGSLLPSENLSADGGARCVCKLHVRVALPSPPDTDLTASAYETYSITYKKLVDLQVDNTKDLKEYKGEVGAVGDVVLQQLTFFSRIGEAHRTLVSWLVLTKVKPHDPGLLLPLLREVRDCLVASNYATTQKRELNTSLSRWIRRVLSDEFEMLHTSFPSTSLLVELPRLENYLRCFHLVEDCYELRMPFERELSTQGLPACVTDLLLAALSKHADTWIDALFKEKLKPPTATTTTTSPSNALDDSEVILDVPTEWQVWQEALRRASILTNPILNFLAISMHTYQPIFMIEMGVDYLYLVMPKLLTAAQLLVSPLLAFDVDRALPLQKDEVLPAALKSAWALCDNLSEINKLSIKSDLPQHLIPQEYRQSFSSSLIFWLALSKHLAFGEFEKEVEQDEFVALEDMEGYSQSAVDVADLLRALMKRLSAVSWPGGVGPSLATVDKIAGHLLELVRQYKSKVTEAYTLREGPTGRISVEVCAVVRNVEHVCDETRKHLVQLSNMCSEGEAKGKTLDLSERSKQLQSYIDDSAEELLKTCLPTLEHLLEKGVTRGSPEYLQKNLEDALEPVEDRLYFAEPLLHELWIRLFRHAMLLKEVYIKSGWRERLRKLREVLMRAHTFLTDHQGVGFHLTQAATADYETLQEDLKILGATSEELVALYYHERLRQQERELSNASAPYLIVNVAFVETGLRIHVVQAPGQQRGVLVKARLEPKHWFPKIEPLKTQLVKEDPAVFDQVLEFPEVHEDIQDVEQGGILTLQLRTPKILGNSLVHGEVILPLKDVARISKEDLHTTRHTRLPLTRPWKLSTYRPLEALKTRPLDKIAVASLKDLAERWEPGDRSSQIQESQKIRATFARAGSMRTPSSAGKANRRQHGGSMRLGSVK